ncbi:unnamed protein product [Macrosiphum euphorbiae]|uniref:Uncharacterized protein n=1 Tax=Macrosiphum euphorbiae TaxID=13131 RepID=A0AAV0WR42_9HEMI|nr:unnamed protein product [Macrosiphum euphorbiae]
MAFTARLYILLAIAVPILALPVFGTFRLPILATTDDLPEEYPIDEPQREDTRTLDEIINTIQQDECPPFGHIDNSFNVTVLGTTAPKIGGCAFMAPRNLRWRPSFNLWLGSPETGGGKCGDKSKYNKSLLLQHDGDG